jgi:hypothetical protein
MEAGFSQRRPGFSSRWLHETHGGSSDTQSKYLSELFVLLTPIIISPLLHHSPVGCAITLTKQTIIIQSTLCSGLRLWLDTWLISEQSSFSFRITGWKEGDDCIFFLFLFHYLFTFVYSFYSLYMCLYIYLLLAFTVIIARKSYSVISSVKIELNPTVRSLSLSPLSGLMWRKDSHW